MCRFLSEVSANKGSFLISIVSCFDVGTSAPTKIQGAMTLTTPFGQNAALAVLGV